MLIDYYSATAYAEPPVVTRAEIRLAYGNGAVSQAAHFYENQVVQQLILDSSIAGVRFSIIISSLPEVAAPPETPSWDELFDAIIARVPPEAWRQVPADLSARVEEYRSHRQP